jgi:beta-xylosidase
MKKRILLTIIVLLALTSCASASTPKAEPSMQIVPINTIAPISTIAPKTEPSMQTVPTNTIVPTSTIAPTPTPNPPIFRDDFNGSLGPGWQWINESKKTWGLTSKAGWLEITVGSGGVGTINTLVRAIPDGNFELETKLTFEPVANYQIAGLVIFYNYANYILMGRAFCGNCVGDGYYLDYMKSGVLTGGNFNMPAPGMDTVYLRLRREGTNYTSFYSEDGSNWIKLGKHTSNFQPKFVGLATGQSTKGSPLAQFDYFIINEIP